MQSENKNSKQLVRLGSEQDLSVKLTSLTLQEMELSKIKRRKLLGSQSEDENRLQRQHKIKAQLLQTLNIPENKKLLNSAGSSFKRLAGGGARSPQSTSVDGTKSAIN